MKCIVCDKEIKEMNFGNRAKVMCHICAVLETRDLTLNLVHKVIQELIIINTGINNNKLIIIINNNNNK